LSIVDSKSVEYSLDKVASEALTEIVAEIEAGKNEAVEQLRSMNRSTKSEVTKILETSAREAESIQRQILGSAELEARNSTLRALEEASNRIIQDSLKAVSEKRAAAYEQALAKLISEGALVIGKDAIVHSNAKDKKLVGSIVKELNKKSGFRLEVSDEDIQAMGGVVLQSKDGTIRYDNTLEARLERIKPQLRREIVDVLSGESKTPEK
jgi:V/A-type H+-transporting ATPase subunit E